MPKPGGSYSPAERMQSGQGVWEREPHEHALVVQSEAKIENEIHRHPKRPSLAEFPNMRGDFGQAVDADTEGGQHGTPPRRWSLVRALRETSLELTRILELRAAVLTVRLSVWSRGYPQTWLKLLWFGLEVGRGVTERAPRGRGVVTCMRNPECLGGRCIGREGQKTQRECVKGIGFLVIAKGTVGWGWGWSWEGAGSRRREYRGGRNVLEQRWERRPSQAKLFLTLVLHRVGIRVVPRVWRRCTELRRGFFFGDVWIFSGLWIGEVGPFCWVFVFVFPGWIVLCLTHGGTHYDQVPWEATQRWNVFFPNIFCYVEPP